MSECINLLKMYGVEDKLKGKIVKMKYLIIELNF